MWRIRDVYPGPIPDQKTAIKDIDGKTCVVIHFFRGIKFTKLNYFIFEKKICANFQIIIEIFTPKIISMLSKIWVWDPGSEIRDKPIPDPGVKKAPDPGSGSATLLQPVTFYPSGVGA